MNTTLEQLEALAAARGAVKVPVHLIRSVTCGHIRNAAAYNTARPHEEVPDELIAFLDAAGSTPLAAIAQQVRKMQDEIAERDAEIERLRKVIENKESNIMSFSTDNVRLTTELAAARKVIERLPVTRDGVPIFNGMKAWRMTSTFERVTELTCALSARATLDGARTIDLDATTAYSTEAGALAASDGTSCFICR